MVNVNYGASDSYANELNSRLVNPFIGKRPEEMFKLLEDFLRETEVENLYHDNFRKGAFLAQDPDALRQPRNDLGLQLDQDEHEALRREKESKWNQKSTMYALVGCCSLGAAVQGWYVYTFRCFNSHTLDPQAKSLFQVY